MKFGIEKGSRNRTEKDNILIKRKGCTQYTDSVPVCFPLMARTQMKHCHNGLNSCVVFVLAAFIGRCNSLGESSYQIDKTLDCADRVQNDRPSRKMALGKHELVD